MLDRIQRSTDLSSIANYARSSPVRGGGGGLSAAEIYQINQLDAVRKISAFGFGSISSDIGAQVLSQRFMASSDVKISAAARTQSSLAEFKTQLQQLTQASNPLKIQSAQPQLINATPIQGGKLQSALSLEVKQLAQGQQIQSRNFAPTELEIGTGKLVLQRASLSAGGEATLIGTAVTINITSQNNTLAGIAQAINGSGATLRAEVVRDSAGSRLELTGQATGQEQGFLVAAQDDDGNNTDNVGLSSLNFDPKNGQAPSRAAQDAKLTINGREVTSANNVFEDKASNLQLQLVGQGEATLTVVRDVDRLTKNFTDLVDRYNQLQETLQNVGGATSSKVRSQLSERVSNLSVGNGLAQLGGLDIGLSSDRSGKLYFNETRLSQQALAKPESVNDLFNLMADRLQVQVTSALNVQSGFANVLSELRDISRGLASKPDASSLLQTGENFSLPLNSRALAGVVQYVRIAQLQ